MFGRVDVSVRSARLGRPYASENNNEKQNEKKRKPPNLEAAPTKKNEHAEQVAGIGQDHNAFFKFPRVETLQRTKRKQRAQNKRSIGWMDSRQRRGSPDASLSPGSFCSRNRLSRLSPDSPFVLALCALQDLVVVAQRS